MGFALIIISAIIGIITVSFDSLPKEAIMPLLAISGIGFVSGIVLVNYKAKHSKRDKGGFKRTNTKSWGA
ncbi:MAG: hypothetical protein COA77_04900 [Thaumarchaeota archaeon]|nr:MAG: hypothetical protein COA77_04900 [Nitrososphaerota archaeon]